MRHFLIMLLCIAAPLCAQENTTIPSNRLVSNEAFTDLIFNDLNFLVLGDNTPSQGFSSELTNKKSELSVKGLLHTGNAAIYTVDGTFAVDDGVYFFDEDGGSKKSRIEMNMFIPFKGKRSFNPAPDNEATQRVMLQNAMLQKSMVIEAYDKFYKLRKLCQVVKIPIEDDLDVLTSTNNYLLKKVRDYKLDKRDFGIKEENTDLENAHIYLSWLKEFKVPFTKKYNVVKEEKENKKEDKDKDADAVIALKYKIVPTNPALEIKLDPTISVKIEPTEVITSIDVNGEQKLVTVLKEGKVVQKQIDIEVLIEKYEQSLQELKKLKDTIEAKELANAETHWNLKRLPFVGLSAYYQRESINIFTPVANASFGDLFDTTLGDLYGVTASGNLFFQKGRKYIYGRVKTSYGRGSNINSFKKNTFVLNAVVGDSIPGVTTSKQEVGYTSSENKGYKYGATSSETLEVYGSMGTVGAFFIIGHTGTYFDFADTGLNDTNTYPARLGLLFNLKNKKDAKNAITLQAFVDRSDLSIDPTGTKAKPIDDWRFGFQIGLPIYLRAKKY